MTHVYHVKINNFFSFSSANEYKSVLAGNLLPDIRYLLQEKRNYTHFFDKLLSDEDQDWVKINFDVGKSLFNCKNVEFKTGYAAHIFLDILWSKNIYPSYVDKNEELSDKIILELLLVSKIDREYILGLENIFINEGSKYYSEQQLNGWENFVQKYFNSLFTGEREYLQFFKTQSIVAIPNLNQLLSMVKNKLNDDNAMAKVESILNSDIFKITK